MNSAFNNKYLIFFTGLLLGFFFIILPVVGYSLSHYPGDLGDGRLNLYFLEHSYKFLTFQLDTNYWDAPFMYPAAQILTYSDNLLGSAPIYGVFRLIGISIFTSYQLWYITVAFLNYFCAYLFFKYLTNNSYGAVLGAMVFAFSIALVSQTAHAQMFPRFGIPLTLLMACKFHNSLSAKDFFWMTFFFVYQMYCGIYLGFFLLVPLLLFSLFTVVIRYKDLLKQLKSRTWLIQLTLGLIINGLLLWWLITPYLLRSKNGGTEPYSGVFETLPRLQSYFQTGKGTLIWDYLSNVGSDVKFRWEFEIFPGAIAMIGFLSFIILIIYKKIKKSPVNNLVLGLGITAVLTFVLFLKIGDKSLYYIIYHLPGYSAMRSMARIINIELLFFGMGVSYVYAELFKKTNGKSFLIFAAFACMLTIDNYSDLLSASRNEKKEAQELMTPVQNTLNNLPKGSVVSYEPSEVNANVIHYQITAMLASQENNIKVVNGYTGNSPAGYDRFWHDIDKDSRNYWLSFNECDFDTLHVLSSPTRVKSYSISKIREEAIKRNFEIKVEEMVKAINLEPSWVEQIKVKAKKNQISLDSAIYLDAVWVINDLKKK